MFLRRLGRLQPREIPIRVGSEPHALVSVDERVRIATVRMWTAGGFVDMGTVFFFLPRVDAALIGPHRMGFVSGVQMVLEMALWWTRLLEQNPN